jgi:hypothetical protein
MAGLIIFDPDDNDVGLSTGDDVAVNTFLDIETDTLYFTDGLNIYEWEGDTAGVPQTYTWKSGQIRLPSPVNLGAALVEAELYSRTNGDPLFADVIHLGKWEGTDGATAYTELAQSDTHTFYGNAQIDTAQQNFDTSSLLFDGTSDGVQSVGDTIYNLASTDDVTVEGFVRLNSLPTTGNTMQLFNHAQTDFVSFGAEIRNNGGTIELRGRFGIGSFPTAAITTPTLGQWYHFAVQRRYNGGAPIVDLFWNGTRVGSVSSANTPDDMTGVPITFGAWDNATTQVFTEVLDGWLDDTRVTTAARYGDVAAYTVPDASYQTAAGATETITFRLYADGVLKHTEIVSDDEPFRLPGGYLSNLYEVELESTLSVTRVSVAENIFELAEG